MSFFRGTFCDKVKMQDRVIDVQNIMSLYAFHTFSWNYFDSFFESVSASSHLLRKGKLFLQRQQWLTYNTPISSPPFRSHSLEKIERKNGILQKPIFIQPHKFSV